MFQGLKPEISLFIRVKCFGISLNFLYNLLGSSVLVQQHISLTVPRIPFFCIVTDSIQIRIGNQKIEADAGIVWNIFNNPGHFHLVFLIHRQDFSYGIFIAKIFLGHALCNQD